MGLRIVITGGTGQLGRLLESWLEARGHQVVVIGRRQPGDRRWDGRTLGPWAAHLDGADAVINLAGRSVSCRYTEENLRQMMDSRVASTQVVGAAIARAQRPPRVWLQMSTATIYAHTLGPAHGEPGGVLGGQEEGAPGYWRRSVEIALGWERALQQARTPRTRKVALRTAMVMSPGEGGVFAVLSRLVRFGLGGPCGGGAQFVSWIHGEDFARAVLFLIERQDLEGPVNLAAPEPLPQRAFMAALRRAWGRRVGLPATRWMLEVGAVLLRTDTELLLKSRRVVPHKLLQAGFVFRFPAWADAAVDLVRAARQLPAPTAMGPSSASSRSRSRGLGSTRSPS